MRAGLERRQLRILERRHDEQDGVGAQRARLGDLVLVDDELLAQRRQRARIARGHEILARALEERLVGEHRQARGAGALVGGGDGRRVERFAQHALARARLLDLGDDRGVARRRSSPAAPARIRAARALRALGVDDRERPRHLRRDDFLRLDGDDLVEDVALRHRDPHGEEWAQPELKAEIAFGEADALPERDAPRRSRSGPRPGCACPRETPCRRRWNARRPSPRRRYACSTKKCRRCVQSGSRETARSRREPHRFRTRARGSRPPAIRASAPRAPRRSSRCRGARRG